MAEKATEKAPEKAAEKATDMIVLLNKGIRTFHTSLGKLEPDMTLALPAKEAAKFLGYADILDASKAAKASVDGSLKAENQALKAEIDRLNSANTDLTAKVAELQSDLDELLKKPSAAAKP